MRSYDHDKCNGERRSFAFYILPHRSALLFLILFYCLSVVVAYAFSTRPNLEEEPIFFNRSDRQRRFMPKRSHHPGVGHSGHFGHRKSRTRLVRGADSMTADTYPMPSDRTRCDYNYLKLNFVCDPDNFLSHTEAGIINNTLGKKFFHCFPSSSASRGGDDNYIYDLASVTKEDGLKQSGVYYTNKANRNWADIVQKERYTIGIALAKTMQYGNSESCGDSGSGIDQRYDLDQNRVIKSMLEQTKVLQKMATKLRVVNWSNREVGCTTDILILLVQNVVKCADGTKGLFNSSEPLMGLSFSARVKRLLSEVSASKLEQSRRRPNTKGDKTAADFYKNDRGGQRNCRHSNCIINMIRRIMQVLDDSLPFLADADDRGDDSDNNNKWDQSKQPQAGNEKEKPKPAEDGLHGITWFAHPQHSVPTWALIAFAVSVCVTLACTCLGHWVNTGRSRLHASSDAASAAKYHLHNRRWRAGFGGGMLELHNNQQKGYGGAGGGMPQRTVRAKMFGGIGMGPASRSRQANGAQHNYNRV